MKKIFIALIPILFTGCDEKDCNCPTTPTDDGIPFEINFLEYSENNYFIDKVYADTSAELNMYNLFYGNIPSIVIPEYYVKEIEVYKSVNAIDGSSIYACAYIDLHPRLFSDTYSDTLRYNEYPIPGEEEFGRFKRLNEGSEYLLHKETGCITFLISVNRLDVIGIAYRIENNDPSISDDLIYGEFMADLINNSDSVAVLKLVKPKSPQPFFETAWKLNLKNRYPVSTSVQMISNLDFDIYLVKPDGSQSNTINNKSLLELFGFDKFKSNGELGPDGKFDNRIGYNYNPITSEIIFPVLQPFGNDIPAALSEYKFHWLYDTVKVFLSLPENYFVIKGKYDPIY